MPGYIPNALHKFQHPPPEKPEHAPHVAEAPVYKWGLQLVPAPDLSPPVLDKHKCHIQQILGMLLFYTWAVNPTMLVAINSIVAQQASTTVKTAKAIV
eukprot:13852341-Ditylum_brightwellii.AAC.1